MREHLDPTGHQPPAEPVCSARDNRTSLSLTASPTWAHDPTPYPHLDQIRRAIGDVGLLTSVVDPEGCRLAGVPAFTDDGVTHFASPDPDLRVAAHEAAHQLQHRGLTNDHRLGAERHAEAVAEGVLHGNGRGVIGRAGSPVRGTFHPYTEGNADGKTDKVSAVSGWRIADTGETMTHHSQDAFATKEQISMGNGTLKAKGSGISLSAGATSKTIESPDKSKAKTLHQVKVAVAGSAAGQLPNDCRKAAREIMGLKDPTMEAVKVNFGGQTVTLQSTHPRWVIAETNYVEEQVASEPGFSSLRGDQKRAVINKAMANFKGLSKDRMKAYAAKNFGSGVSDDAAALPGIGEAFAVYPGSRSQTTGYEFHYATVVMIPGSDRVTLENPAGDRSESRNSAWFFHTYGTKSGQSFHEQSATAFGGDRHTYVVREADARTPANQYLYKYTDTSTLLAKFRVTTDPDEAIALEAVLKKRKLHFVVTCESKFNASTDDWIRIEVAGNADAKKKLGITEPKEMNASGKSMQVFELSLGSVWPVDSSLTVELADARPLPPNHGGALYSVHAIDAYAWPAPLADKTDVLLKKGTAKYKVTCSTIGQEKARAAVTSQ